MVCFWARAWWRVLGGACLVRVLGGACLWAGLLDVPVGGGPPVRSPHASLTARSGRSRSPARPCHRPRAPQLTLSNFARNSPVTVSNVECASLELQRFQRLLKLFSNELRATFRGWLAADQVPRRRMQEQSLFRGFTVSHRVPPACLTSLRAVSMERTARRILASRIGV